MNEEAFESMVEIVPRVKCEVCGKPHLKTPPEYEKDTYISIYGDIKIGMNKVPWKSTDKSNFDKDGKLKSVTILCKDMGCISDYMKRFVNSGL